MTGRIRAERGSPVGGLHLQMSRLLLGCLLAAVAATGALIVTVAVNVSGPPGGGGRPPGSDPGGGPGGPPPVDAGALALFAVVTGLFVLTWLAALVVFSRDQVLRRIRDLPAEPAADPADARRELEALVTELRAGLAADRTRELGELSDRIAAMTSEYGEQRETDGYLNGMRVATGNEPPEQKVRSIRPLN
jgi:hypothetical protein